MTRPTVEVNQTEADGLQRFPLELDGTLDEVLAFPTFSGCRQFVTFDGQYAPWTDETQPRTPTPLRFGWFDWYGKRVCVTVVGPHVDLFA